MDWPVKKSLALNKSIGNKELMAQNYGNIGTIKKLKGDLDKALEYFSQSLAISQEIGSKESMAKSYGNIGLVHKEKGDLDQALGYFEHSLTVSMEVGSQPIIELGIRQIRELCEKYGLEKACEVLEEAVGG